MSNKKERSFWNILSFSMVRVIGFEPIRDRSREILSLLRLPISPYSHIYAIKFNIYTMQGILSPLRLPIPPLGHISHILYNIPYYPWSYMKFFPAGAQKLFFVAAAKKHLCVRRFCRTCMEWENYSKLLQGCQAGFGDRARARPKKSYPQALVAALRRLWKGGA